MKARSLLPVVLVSLCSAAPAFAQDETIPPITQTEALALGPEKIAAKLGDESEHGWDRGALYYAAAKRLETDSRLAAKNLLLVLDLENLRRAIAEWDDAWCEGLWHVSGGGTLWSHLQSRNDAVLEDLLAEFADRLPLKPGSASAETLAKWGTVEKAIAAATLPEDTDAEARVAWKRHQAVMKEKWQRLDVELQAIADADARVILKHILPDPEQLAEFGGK